MKKSLTASKSLAARQEPTAQQKILALLDAPGLELPAAEIAKQIGDTRDATNAVLKRLAEKKVICRRPRYHEHGYFIGYLYWRVS